MTINNSADTPTISPQNVITNAIRVLHIDDDETQQEFLKIFVEIDKAIKITSIKSATDALQIIQAGTHDCLITDYDMPEIDGISLVKKIRKTSNIPIIIYTGRGSEEVAERAFEAGVDDYIRKEQTPAHYQLVSNRIRQVVERKRLNESYRGLFENASDAIFIHTLDGTILDVNQTCCNRLGYVKDELMGKRVYDLVKADRNVLRERVNKISQFGGLIFESTTITKEGVEIPVEVNASIIKYMGVEAILSFSRDISERIKLERQTKEQMEALQTHALNLGDCRDEVQVAQVTYEILHETMGYDFFGLAIVKNNKLHFIRETYIDDEWVHEYSLDGPGISVKVARTGSTVVVPDVRLDPDYIRPKSGYLYLSEIVIPVKIGGEVIAVINIEDKQVNRFTRNDVTLLELFSEHIASALQRLALFSSTKKNLERLEKVKKHAIHLSSLNTIKEVAEASFEIITELLGCEYVSIGIVEEDRLHFHYAKNMVIDTIPFLPLSGRGITVRAVNTGQAQLVHDTSIDPDYVTDHDPNVFLSELDVPIFDSEKVIGVISLENVKSHYFSAEDKDVVEILAEHISSALANIKNVGIISESNMALSESEARFKYILDSTPNGITVNIDGQIVYVNQFFSEMMGYTIDELLHKTVYELTSAEHLDLVVDRTNRRARGEEVPSNYEVDLIRKDGSKIPVEFSVSVIDFLGKKASLTMIKDLSKDRERDNLEHRIIDLQRHTRLLNEATKIQEAAKLTLDILSEHLKCEFVSLQNVIGGYLHIVSTRGTEPIGIPMPIHGPGLTAKVARERVSILVNDIFCEPHFVKGNTETRSELAAPIICKDQLLGVLNAESLSPNAFTENDRVLIEALANEVGSTLMRIRRDEAVTETAQFYERIYENIDDGVYVTDSSDKIIYTNVGMEKIAGVEREKLIGHSVIDDFAEDTLSTFRPIYLGAKGSLQRNKYVDIPVTTPAGVGTYQSGEIIPLVKDGEYNGSIVVVRDTTERKLYIEKLESINRKMSALHKNAADLVEAKSIYEVGVHALEALANTIGLTEGSFAVVEGDDITHIVSQLNGRVEIFYNRKGSFSQKVSGGGIVSRTVRLGRTQMVNDVRFDPDFIPGNRAESYRTISELVVPVIVSGKVVAVINVEHSEPGAFSYIDAQMVEILCMHVASHINRTDFLATCPTSKYLIPKLLQK